MSSKLLPEATRPLIFAHRGYSSAAPENTLAAFSLAWEKGIPGVEFDIRICGSGELVVFHDADLERITGVRGTVEKTDLDVIRALDAGSGEKIPLMSEVLELAPEWAYFDIELKIADHNAKKMAGMLAEELEEQGLANRCLVSSFYPSAVRAMKVAGKGIPVAWIHTSDLEQNQHAKYLVGRVLAGAPVLKPQWQCAIEMLKKNRSQKRPIIPWTINDTAVARRCLELGAEGIISDDPAGITE